jgi:hypothetical protein
MNDEIFERLSAPFPADRISWRVGATYIDSRDVQERLDEVCGPAGWQDDYPHAGAKTVCRIGLLLADGWVWKSDGAGDTDVEAEKGALSDAFKRAAVKWGIGRYLYGIPSPWVDLDERKQIKEGEHQKLQDLLTRYTQEFEWGSPESRATLRVLGQTIKNTLQTSDDVRRWREANAGCFAQMRVKAKAHIEAILASIEDASNARAA